MLGTVPSTGTPIKLLNEQFMRDLLSQYSDELVYLGKAYGSSVLLPMWLKHFGQGSGGNGEAYHLGIFGKTGSGKSVLSKMVMTGYARHKPMTIFVLDPQGEFAKIREDNKMLDILEKIGKPLKICSLHNLVLTGNPLFKKVLTLSGFLDELGIVHEDNKARAANQIDMIFQALKTDQVLMHIYSTKDLQERVRSTIQSVDTEYMCRRWKSVALLFTYEGKKESIEIKELTKTVAGQASGQIIIIDLSDIGVPKDTLWNDDVRRIVINEFLKSIEYQAQSAYQLGKSLNTLVVIDEAHRLAPRELKENKELEKVRTTLKDAIRTTRKFGLGWMFISQTLSGLDREIINQLRIYIFGFGLAYGIELLGLREIIGGNDEAIRLYQLFKDPQSNPNR